MTREPAWEDIDGAGKRRKKVTFTGKRHSRGGKEFFYTRWSKKKKKKERKRKSSTDKVRPVWPAWEDAPTRSRAVRLGAPKNTSVRWSDSVEWLQRRVRDCRYSWRFFWGSVGPYFYIIPKPQAHWRSPKEIICTTLHHHVQPPPPAAQSLELSAHKTSNALFTHTHKKRWYNVICIEPDQFHDLLLRQKIQCSDRQ